MLRLKPLIIKPAEKALMIVFYRNMSNSAKSLKLRGEYTQLPFNTDNSLFSQVPEQYWFNALLFLDSSEVVGGSAAPEPQTLTRRFSTGKKSLVTVDQTSEFGKHLPNISKNPVIYSRATGTSASQVQYRANKPWGVVVRNHPRHTKVRYYYRFITIVPLSASSGAELFDARMRNNEYEIRGTHNKILVKQSYLLLTWLAYLRGELTKKKRDAREAQLSVKGFFIKPVRSTKFTTQKAPMAHKTFSQEQWLYKHYSLSFSFEPSNDYLPTYRPVSSANGAIYIGLLLLQSSYGFTTNLLNLSRVTHRFESYDVSYMTVK